MSVENQMGEGTLVVMEMGKAPQEDLRQKTRLIVKGLPPHVDNNRLRKIFEPFGEMTDCKIMYTK
jgi:RNA recognition motif-containing protein